MPLPRVRDHPQHQRIGSRTRILTLITPLARPLSYHTPPCLTHRYVSIPSRRTSAQIVLPRLAHTVVQVTLQEIFSLADRRRTEVHPAQAICIYYRAFPN